MVFHHLVSLTVWPLSFLNNAGTFYVAYFIATEVTSPLLHMTVFFLPKHGIEGGIRTIIGLTLIAVFFFVRVLPAPALWWSLAKSVPFWADVNPIITVLGLTTIPMPSFLFGYWFYKLVAGAVKALTEKKED